MIQCPNCGNLNYEGNNFCGKCGTKLPEPKICPKCHYKSFANDFCVKCGTKLISPSDFVKIKEFMDAAMMILKYEDYKKAIRYYDKVLRIYPNHIDALNYKGFCLSRLHKYDEAINCFDKILEIDSDNSSALRQKGNCLDYQYKYDEAIDCFNQALKIDSDNQFTLKNKLRTLLSMRKYDEVPDILSKIKVEKAFEWKVLSGIYLEINDIDNALKCLDNVDDEYLSELAYKDKFDIYQRLGKYDFIMQNCNEKLEIDSNDLLALKIKASCLRSLKKYEEALICYDKLIEISPNDFRIMFSKCEILFELKKYDDISDILINIKSEFVELRLSEMYLEIKEFDESLRCLDKFIEDSDYFNSEVVDIYLKLDKSQKAFEYIHKALKNDPNDYSALISKGNYYEYLGKFDKALEIYNRLISINKYGVYEYFKKIDLLLKLEKFSEAKSVLLNIKNPNCYLHGYQISKYYEQLNDCEKALEYIDKTINLNYNIEYLVKKAEILYKLERYDEAMEVCRDASKLNSEYNKLIEITNKISNSN